jgi:hypothetical protein
MTTLTRSRIHLLAGLLAACAMSATPAAQWADYPMKNVPRTKDGKVDLNAPPRRTPDGKIDLSGFWLPTNPVKHLLNLAADLPPGGVPLQPWAEALLKERIETNGKDHPGVRCWPSGIPEKLNIPDGLKLVQTPDVMLFLHESRTIYRQVFTDGRKLRVCPRTRSQCGWGTPSAAGRATPSSSKRSVRTARRGSTCAVCRAPRR